jgi:hypothetical protein
MTRITVAFSGGRRQNKNVVTYLCGGKVGDGWNVEIVEELRLLRS